MCCVCKKEFSLNLGLNGIHSSFHSAGNFHTLPQSWRSFKTSTGIISDSVKKFTIGTYSGNFKSKLLESSSDYFIPLGFLNIIDIVTVRLSSVTVKLFELVNRILEIFHFHQKRDYIFHLVLPRNLAT